MPRKRNITTMSEMGAGLMQAFNAINSHFYGGELQKPIITVKEGKKKMLTDGLKRLRTGYREKRNVMKSTYRATTSGNAR